MKRPQTRSLMIFVVTNDATAALPSFMSREGNNYIKFTMHPRHVYTGPKPSLPKGKTEPALCYDNYNSCVKAKCNDDWNSFLKDLLKILIDSRTREMQI